jgi:hypothetical protein
MHLMTRASSSTSQGAHVITHNQRLRLSRFLAIHDALVAGASSRDLAYGLIFPNHRPLSERPGKPRVSGGRFFG